MPTTTRSPAPGLWPDLPYDAVRTAFDPDATLLAFLESSYEAAAVAGDWDRAPLECAPGIAGVPRSVTFGTADDR